MKINKGAYTYPVLSPDEDYYNPTSKFEMNLLTPVKKENTIILEAEFTVDNEEIEKEIENGSFVYCLYIEEPIASFSATLTSELGSNRIKSYIDIGQISGDLKITPTILVKQNLESFKSKEFNSMYFDSDYSIKSLEKGNIIAYGESKKCSIDFINSEKQHMGNVIQLVGEERNNMKVVTDGDYIVIYLPTRTLNEYDTLSKSSEVLADLFVALFIQPALMQIIEEIKNESTFLDESLLWGRVLKDSLELKGFDVEYIDEDSLLVVQEILNLNLENVIHKFYEWSDGVG